MIALPFRAFGKKVMVMPKDRFQIKNRSKVMVLQVEPSEPWVR